VRRNAPIAHHDVYIVLLGHTNQKTKKEVID